MMIVAVWITHHVQRSCNPAHFAKIKYRSKITQYEIWVMRIRVLLNHFTVWYFQTEFVSYPITWLFIDIVTWSIRTFIGVSLPRCRFYNRTWNVSPVTMATENFKGPICWLKIVNLAFRDMCLSNWFILLVAWLGNLEVYLVKLHLKFCLQITTRKD